MTGINTLNNVAKSWAGASQAVVSAVKNASARTGVDFNYLMAKARQESSFDPTLRRKPARRQDYFSLSTPPG
jgi:soluble lytic murein transglycosylase-like protein